MSTYVVTGGAGFIGSHIAEELLRRKHSVRIVDDFSSGKVSNIEAILKDIELFRADISDPSALANAFRDADFVIHQAGIVSVQKTMNDPVGTHRVNVDGTLNVLAAARDAHVKRVVFASSAAVYGDNPELPKREEMSPEPMSPYGVQKLCSEIYCRLYSSAFQLETVVLRYFNVFGPRQDPSSPYSGVIAKFIPTVLQGQQPTVFGDGEQSRDFVFVSNVVDANLSACTAEGVSGETFNIACGTRITVNTMLAQIRKIAGNGISSTNTVLRLAQRAGDILHSQADVTRARTRMNYQAQTKFEDGLQQTVEWYRQQSLS